MLRENIKLNTIKLSHMRKMRHLRSIWFTRKLSVKIIFHIFQCLVTKKKKKKKLVNRKLSLVNGKS